MIKMPMHSKPPQAPIRRTAPLAAPATNGPLAALATIAVLAALAATPVAAQFKPIEQQTERTAIRLVTLAHGLERPWSLAFLPDGRMLVTERPGRLRIVTADGTVSPPVAGVPEVLTRGQAGLLDILPSPDFARDSTIFFSYAEPFQGGGRTAVARAVLRGTALADVRVIFRQAQGGSGGNHWGSRLVFARDGTLFVTLGDRYEFRDRAQDLTSHYGKVVRINPDGSVPRDNPYVGRAGALPEIWSIGHRNLQGAALHPVTGQLWTHEHGAQGGDEINRPEAGKNYGWPVITHGVDYSGAPIGIGTAAPGLEQPLLHWTPSIAPSGMAFYTSARIAPWRGNLFVGSLKNRRLVRLELDGERVVHQESLLTSIGRRIRDVRQGPDGALYLLTDEPAGMLLRIEPKG
ncbi:MAG: PQQ-dependent sugar dehydrogenase [Lautropia sp.]